MKFKIVIILSILLFYSQLFAKWGIGPKMGYYKTKDADEGNFFYGLQTKGKIFTNFGWESSIEYHIETYKDKMLEVRSWPLMFSLIMYPFKGIYGIIGVGAYSNKYDYDKNGIINRNIPIDDEPEDKFDFMTGYHIGAGIELRTNTNVTFNSDFRYIYQDYETIFKDNPEADFWSIALGFTFYIPQKF